MNKKTFDMGPIDIAWCPGCGNYRILDSLKSALAELDIRPQELVICSGIGQAAKTPHYLRTNVLNGLHGRALPPATAIKAVNPNLTVIAIGGDGDMYGEGGNHLVHAIRRNPDITNIVHNNMVYGLTKGQASPTSREGFQTPTQPFGVYVEPFNPIAVAVALDASFVARANAGDEEQTKEILKKAITHKGYALVDIFQPCVTFNKLNTYKWFSDHTYYLDESYDPSDRVAAFQKALETDRFPLGIIYVNPTRPAYEENVWVYKENPEPLFRRELNTGKLETLFKSMR